MSASAEATAKWITDLADAVRRCYISDERLEERAIATSRSEGALLPALFPDRGSTMSGDFGEIVAFLFLASDADGVVPIGPKKWRLKQDRTKPAPGSDIVQFVVPSWPNASTEDRLVCAEVKTKATDTASTPIASAIADSKKDRLGRLAKTLVWLQERALLENLGATSLELVDRFINATQHPPAKKQFWAVAVVCSSLVEAEIAAAPEPVADDPAVAVIAIPELQQQYEQTFDAALRSKE